MFSCFVLLIHRLSYTTIPLIYLLLISVNYMYIIRLFGIDANDYKLSSYYCVMIIRYCKQFAMIHQNILI